eukprot:1214236-Ditylum_brightwellii.AAC.1
MMHVPTETAVPKPSPTSCGWPSSSSSNLANLLQQKRNSINTVLPLAPPILPQQHAVHSVTASIPVLQHLPFNFCSLTFDNQKNSVKDKAISHRPTGNLQACLVEAACRRAVSLQLQGANSNMPLATDCTTHCFWKICSTEITDALRHSVNKIGHKYGFTRSA